MGAVSPFASPWNTSSAPLSATGMMISSFTSSYAMPCIVRERFVACPSITRVGATLPFASLANTEILGTLTQLGTSRTSRFESYAAADALVKPQVGVFTGAFLTIRFGFTLPVAVREKTTAVWSP